MSLRVKAISSPPPAQGSLPPVIAVSSAMQSALAEAQHLAAQDCSVLIQGETGTGKELLARAVHGGRGPFVVVDCTHLSPQLAESELFGHVRGAYTSADSERRGLIAAAHNGAAFFDEIGELSLEVQAKLLRLLQQKTFRRVGSSEEQRSDFRIIAATNRDLQRESQTSRFRQDLYYRLNVAKIKVPALRERKEDIPFLVRHFLQPTGLEVPAEVMETLCRFDWPGNVRELEHCVKRMEVMSCGGRISLSHVPATICAQVSERTPKLLKMTTAFPSLPGGLPLPPLPSASPQPEVPLLSLQELEYWGILRALREMRGDRTRAADLLKIGRTTLYRKLNEMQKHPQFAAAVRQIVGEIFESGRSAE